MLKEELKDKVRRLSEKILKLVQYTNPKWEFADILCRMYPKIKIEDLRLRNYVKLLALTLNKEISRYSIQAGDSVGLISINRSVGDNSDCTALYITPEKAEASIDWYRKHITSYSKPILITQKGCELILNANYAPLTADGLAKRISSKFLMNTHVEPFHNNGVPKVIWRYIYNRQELVDINKKQQEEFNQLIEYTDESVFWLLFDSV